MNLVVGATGSLGSEICRRLAAEGKLTLPRFSGQEVKPLKAQPHS